MNKFKIARKLQFNNNKECGRKKKQIQNEKRKCVAVQDNKI